MAAGRVVLEGGDRQDRAGLPPPFAVPFPRVGGPANQVALGAAGVSEYSFVATQISGAVLVGFTVLFGGIAIRRLARRG